MLQLVHVLIRQQEFMPKCNNSILKWHTGAAVEFHGQHLNQSKNDAPNFGEETGWKAYLHFLNPFNLISGLVPDCIDKKLSFMLAVDGSMMNKIQTQ